MKNVIVSGWNNGTGFESNISVYMSTAFTPLVGQSVMLIIPTLWKITPLTPVIVMSSSVLNNLSSIYILSNMTVSSSAILFNANIINPGFVIPLTL